MIDVAQKRLKPRRRHFVVDDLRESIVLLHSSFGVAVVVVDPVLLEAV